MKQRTHNEWFQPSCYGKCDCGSNKRSRLQAGVDPIVYIWGEYSNARWRSIQKLCQLCFYMEVIPRLRSHANTCGCTFAVCARSGYSLPAWLRLPDNFQVCAA